MQPQRVFLQLEMPEVLQLQGQGQARLVLVVAVAAGGCQVAGLMNQAAAAVHGPVPDKMQQQRRR